MVIYLVISVTWLLLKVGAMILIGLAFLLGTIF